MLLRSVNGTFFLTVLCTHSRQCFQAINLQRPFGQSSNSFGLFGLFSRRNNRPGLGSTADLSNDVTVLWCLACGKPVAHQTKSFVASHLTRQCHIAGKTHIAKQQAKKEAVAKQKDEEVVAMQRVSTLRQPTLGHVVSCHAERFAVQDDLVFTMLASGILVEKLDHPIMRAFLRKYTSISGCLSQLGSEFPKHNCSHLQDAHQKVIGDKLRGQTRPSGTLIRLSFVTDHTTCLI